MAVPGGLEPPTFGLGNRCSVLLSYGTSRVITSISTRRVHRSPFDRRAWRAAVLACLAAPIVAPVASQDAKGAPRRAPIAACAASPSEDDVIEAVSPEGAIKLASGRLAKLEGIRLPEGEHRDQAHAALRLYAGRTVTVAAKHSGADRWGRISASIALAGKPVRLDLAQSLVERGLAVADAGQADAVCTPELLAIESTAREQGLGVWATDGYKPTSADDVGLRTLAGRFVLVEGRIRSIGERQQRTYLNFGSDWANDFTIIIPKRTWAIMRDRGLSARALNGRRVRGRGVIEIWRGPTMEISAAEMLEILDPDRTRR